MVKRRPTAQVAMIQNRPTALVVILKKTAYHTVGQLVITKSTYRKDDHDTKPT